jgi:hypothetical protein
MKATNEDEIPNIIQELLPTEDEINNRRNEDEENIKLPATKEVANKEPKRIE